MIIICQFTFRPFNNEFKAKIKIVNKHKNYVKFSLSIFLTFANYYSVLKLNWSAADVF